MDETVLAYIFKQDKVLMLYRNKKKNDINEGKWMGVGGHIEKGETPDQALKREVKEETNLDVKEYQLLGVIYFSTGEYHEKMYLYKVNEAVGELIECNEGDLSYIDKKDLLSLNMWEGDRIFLQYMENEEPYFELELVYDNDTLMRWKRLK